MTLDGRRRQVQKVVNLEQLDVGIFVGSDLSLEVGESLTDRQRDRGWMERPRRRPSRRPILVRLHRLFSGRRLDNHPLGSSGTCVPIKRLWFSNVQDAKHSPLLVGDHLFKVLLSNLRTTASTSLEVIFCLTLCRCRVNCPMAAK